MAQKEKRRKAEKRPLTCAVRNVNILSWIEKKKELASYFKKWPRRPEEIQEVVMSQKQKQKKYFKEGGYGQFGRMSVKFKIIRNAL